MKFRRLKKVLRNFGIEWDKDVGKGSHGSFFGLTYKTKIRRVYVLPNSQQVDVQRKYIRAPRRHFELTTDNMVSDSLFT